MNFQVVKFKLIVAVLIGFTWLPVYANDDQELMLKAEQMLTIIKSMKYQSFDNAVKIRLAKFDKLTSTKEQTQYLKEMVIFAWNAKDNELKAKLMGQLKTLASKHNDQVALAFVDFITIAYDETNYDKPKKAKSKIRALKSKYADVNDPRISYYFIFSDLALSIRERFPLVENQHVINALHDIEEQKYPIEKYMLSKDQQSIDLNGRIESYKKHIDTAKQNSYPVNSPVILYNLIRLSQQENAYDVGIKLADFYVDFVNVNVIETEYFYANLLHGFCLNTLNRFKEAIAAYEKASDFIPGNSPYWQHQIHMYRGLNYAMDGNLSAAKADLSAVMKLNEEYPELLDANLVNVINAEISYLEQDYQSYRALNESNWNQATASIVKEQNGKLNEVQKILLGVINKEQEQRKKVEQLLVQTKLYLGIMIVFGLFLILFVYRYFSQSKDLGTLNNQLSKSIAELKESQCELESKNKEISYRADHDYLTGMLVLNKFTDIANLALKQKMREERQIAIAFIDLDGFKAVNDTWGHNAGDAVLRSVATKLLSNLREQDFVCRVGGDEFILLFNSQSPSDWTLVCNRLLAAIKEPHYWEEKELYVSASIGLAIAEEGDTDVKPLIKQADLLMYNVKKDGKGSFRLSDSG